MLRIGSKNKFSYFAIFTILLVFFSKSVTAQITDQAINFNSSKLDLIFLAPFRSDINSPHPLKYELPRLNLIVNVFENYLQYLTKLKKIANSTSIQLKYSPGQAIDTFHDPINLIRINELGLNHILDKVNQYLREKPNTDKAYLLDRAKSLFTIPDQLPRKACKLSDRLKIQPISSLETTIEPETEFCLGKKVLFFSRPSIRSNKLYKATHNSPVSSFSQILRQSKKWYSDFSTSPTGNYLALTDGGTPQILNLKTSKLIEPFKKNDLMLSMVWSPKNDILAGMVLNNDTRERRAYIFDMHANAFLNFFENNENFQPNHLYANPYWSPDGTKIIFTSGNELHLLNLRSKQSYPSCHQLPNKVSELIWSDDSNSFACVEIVGQTRDKNIFDDLDLRKSILHRFRITDPGKIIEDNAQRIESRNTIKLVSFWTLDRVLYLEGRLVSKRLNSPVWDLSSTFKAYLTPTPSISVSKEEASDITKTDKVNLPMKYLYVFRNLDGKYKNVYDAGFSHVNHLFLDRLENSWFVGLRKPDNISARNKSFNIRQSPYPFSECNVTYISDKSNQKMKKLLAFMQDYNLRSFQIDMENEDIYFLSNFCGPLNIWKGSFSNIIDGLN